MKSNFIHVCFILDCSGSMMSSASDVEGGFMSVIEEQKKNTEGTCAISLYTFETSVHKEFIGKDINDVEPFKFKTGGMTAMNDGIGTAIDEIGKWLSDMPEEERPEKNLIVIFTDGIENYSKEYSTEDVRNRIKHQEEKYNWTFMYLGTDITSTKDADDLGISNRGYSIRGKMGNSYAAINCITSTYRKSNGDSKFKNAMLNTALNDTLTTMNAEYLADTGHDMSSDKVTTVHTITAEDLANIATVVNGVAN